MHVFAYNSFGYEGGLVRVEVDLRQGLPVIDIVGLAGAAVREARERIRAALRLSGFEFPHGHILVNLAPAGMPKSGAAYDLPIAYAILIKSGLIPEPEAPVLVMGELTLNGEVTKVDAVLSALIDARAAGIRSAVLPCSNILEAGLLGLESMRFVANLREAVVGPETGACDNCVRANPSPEALRGAEHRRVSQSDGRRLFDTSVFRDNPLLSITLLCAAAGGHHVLLYGPPGTGKTMALRYLGELLPCLSEHEMLEVNRLYSNAGLLGPETGIVESPPVRMPHHSASAEAMVGGGRFCRPGEVSLAHKGLLILDEAPEFRPGNLQALREPLEDGRVRISRADYQVWFPADFTLAMALNSCPCGRLGSATGICVCRPQQVRAYWNRIGGPLLDRMDLRLCMGAQASLHRSAEWMENAARFAHAVGLTGHDWHQRSAFLVGRARSRQSERFNGSSETRNARLRGNDITALVESFDGIGPILEDRLRDYNKRGTHAIIRIARTLADLDDDSDIRAEHIDLACALRQPIAPMPGFEIQD